MANSIGTFRCNNCRKTWDGPELVHLRRISNFQWVCDKCGGMVEMISNLPKAEYLKTGGKS